MCNFVNFVHLFCDAIYTGIKFIHKWLNSSVVLSFFDIINDFVVDTSCMLWCTNSRYRILESEFWKGRILPVVPPPHSGMLWLPGAAFLSGAPSLLLFFFCSHAVCLHSPAAYNFTLCNFLHLSGFLSKEEGGPKKWPHYKSDWRRVCCGDVRRLSCSQRCTIRPAALCSASAQCCIYSWGLSQATASSALSSGLVLAVDLNWGLIVTMSSVLGPTSPQLHHRAYCHAFCVQLK